MKPASIGSLVLLFLSFAPASAVPAKPLYEPPSARHGPTLLVPEKLNVLQPPMWSRYGRLEATGMKRDDGTAIYRLVFTDNTPEEFVAHHPGKALDFYVGRTIAVYGPILGVSNARCIFVTHVAVP